jgi:hypothetical protein
MSCCMPSRPVESMGLFATMVLYFIASSELLTSVLHKYNTQQHKQAKVTAAEP